MKVIEFDKLSKWYGAVRGAEEISFSVEQGEIFGFLGPNGAGKTTTLRCALGFLRPSSGEVRIFGQRVRPGRATQHHRLGFLPGDFRAWPRLTGRKVLDLLGGLSGQGNRSRSKEELAERLDVRLDRPIGKLSKGNRQKIGLISAFQNGADLLILDEPTLSLDPLTRRTVLEMVREIGGQGRSVLLSSHDLVQVSEVCQRAAILRDGRLVELSAIEGLLARSEHQLRVWFAGPASFPEEGIGSVRVVERGERYLHLAYRGSPTALLSWLAAHPVERMESPEPTLEEAFLEYFRQNSSIRSP